MRTEDQQNPENELFQHTKHYYSMSKQIYNSSNSLILVNKLKLLIIYHIAYL